MCELGCVELENIRGGSYGGVILTGLVVTAVIVFISGVIEGITNPKRCVSGSN